MSSNDGLQLGMLTIELPAKVEALESLRETTAGFLRTHGIDPSQCVLLDVALEELVGNIIRYAWADSREHSILVRYHRVEEPASATPSIQITLEDDGHAFDPTAECSPDPTLPVCEMRIGGLGIHMAKQVFASLNYQRGEARNILRLLYRPMMGV
jgi:serine/threonine-protein kinase RsbW